MEMTNLERIQLRIGYEFKNRALICQAFTRKSFTDEHPQAQNNEVLEFYGDKVLDFIVMQKMSQYYGSIGEGNLFYSSLDEGNLTEIKKKLVCRKMLANRIRMLGLQHPETRWLMGRGDIEQKVWRNDSVQEDLFEAILGAVAIDSNWNTDVLHRVVDHMLKPEFYFEHGFEDELNYVQLLQQWHQKKYGCAPTYVCTNCVSAYQLLNDNEDENASNTIYQCNLYSSFQPFNFFSAIGATKQSARMNVAKKAYEYLELNNLVNDLGDELGTPDFDRAVNQLQELYQKGYIGEPVYTFTEMHDENGNPIWDCECRISGLDLVYSVKDSSKKHGKKAVAFEMVKLYLNWEGNSNDATE